MSKRTRLFTILTGIGIAGAAIALYNNHKKENSATDQAKDLLICVEKSDVDCVFSALDKQEVDASGITKDSVRIVLKDILQPSLAILTSSEPIKVQKFTRQSTASRAYFTSDKKQMDLTISAMQKEKSTHLRFHDLLMTAIAFDSATNNDPGDGIANQFEGMSASLNKWTASLSQTNLKGIVPSSAYPAKEVISPKATADRLTQTAEKIRSGKIKVSGPGGKLIR